MKNSIQVFNKTIDDNSLFIISEVGNQFNGNKEIAKKLIDATKDAGADAIKFIFWFLDEILADKSIEYSYDIRKRIYPPCYAPKYRFYWDIERKTEPMYDLLNKLRLSNEEWLEVRDYASEKKIAFMSTILSPSGIDLDNFINMDAIKISSWDYNFTDLWKWCAWQDKPLFIDTGTVYEPEIARNLDIINNSEIVLLHCFHTTTYSAMNMLAIPYMRQRFECLVGYSSADINDELDIVALGLGACVLEKRLTLSRSGGILHDALSKEPAEFKEYVETMRNIKSSLGKQAILPSEEDLEQRKKWFRHIVADCDILEGETITRDKLEAKRGEWGISPERMEEIVGKRATRNIKRNESINLDSIR